MYCIYISYTNICTYNLCYITYDYICIYIFTYIDVYIYVCVCVRDCTWLFVQDAILALDESHFGPQR